MRRNDNYYNDDYDLNSFKKKSKNRSSSSTPKRRRKKKVSASKIVLIVACSLIALMLVAGSGGYIYLQTVLSKAERVDIGNKVSIASEAEKKYATYTNIALLGIDTRGEGYDDGRSDAIIILTIDTVHNKIKMTSIARDSYVEIPGRKRKDKITHAYMYGKDPADRAALAVNTINKNYGLNIEDVVTINFYGFAEVIDEIGGVMIDVSEAERKVMNNTYIPFIKKQGIKCEKVQKAGYQRLSGGQALAYSRNRYTGSDLERGSRQREVLTAMFEQVKSTKSLSDMANLVTTILENCTTSLSNSDMIELATWALTERPTVENLGLPDEDCNAYGDTINGTWYYVYDLEIAKTKIEDFIFEQGSYKDPKTASSGASS